jgi:crotonobetainyl-CoA:carnitine CoA-transferase CaiB-like acyl-CoA transferase
VASPFCAAQLADLGADVIKVEPPEGGDQVRLTPPFLDGESSSFLQLNRNKRSTALDLKTAEGREVFLLLARRADVVVENLLPGAMAALGPDYGRLARENPRPVYDAASGCGQDGPLSRPAGLDIMAQARGG